MEKPTVTSLCKAVPISKGYASGILAGKQEPALSLAIYIYRQTGWRHERIATASEQQLKAVEEISPWRGAA